MSEQEQGVQQAESEVAEIESQVAHEAERLQGLVGDLSARLNAVKATVGRAKQAGFSEPAFLDLAARAGQASVPGVSVEREQAAGLAAREQAVLGRRRAAEEAQKALRGFAGHLSKLGAQLSADEAALKAFEQQAREENARRAEGAKKKAAPAPRGNPSPPPAPAKGPAPSKPVAPPRPPASAPPPPPPPATAMATEARGRRERSRVQMEASVDLESDTNFFSGFSTNLSDGGLFIATVQHVAIGTEVDVSFTLPGGGRVQARAVVRWVREVNDGTPDIFPGIGLQFLDLAPPAQQAIGQFLAMREPMFYPG